VADDRVEWLAPRCGVPLEALPQPGLPALLGGMREGRLNGVFMGIHAGRAASIDTSAPYMEVEQGVLVRSGVPLGSLDAIDWPGLRIGVLDKAGADFAPTRQLKQARLVRLVRLPTLDALFLPLAAGELDVVAATKSRLLDEASKLAGSRVLDGRLLVEWIGMRAPRDARPRPHSSSTAS
jgi:polar amino acid transport system substrate-binding protein